MGVKNIIITGIGGQGVLYLSSLLRRALVEKYGAVTGYDVRGGAQRLGHVASIIRFEDSGDAARRLAIDFDDGACDFALALEASELLKFNAKLSSRSLAISDEFIITPTNIRRRDGTYYGFEAIKRHFMATTGKFVHANFRGEAAKKFNGPLSANLIMLGRLLKETGALLGLEDIETACNEEEFKIIKYGFEAI